MNEVPQAQERHALFDRLRQEHPVLRDDHSRSFVLTRYDDVRALLADNSLLRDPDKAEQGALVHAFKPKTPDRPQDRQSSIGWMDAPDHARVRTPLAQAFYKRVSSSRQAITKIVDTRIDALALRQSFDVVQDVAIPVPLAVIGEILGIATIQMAHLRSWSEANMKAFLPHRDEADEADMRSATNAVARILDATMNERRAEPKEDLISDLVLVQASGEPLTDGEIRVSCISLLVGGNISTADLIANAMWLLLSHPRELSKLRDQPGLIVAAIEEVLRFEPPTDGTQRIAPRDMEIRGCPIRKEQVIAVLLAAANRDPTVFQEPHVFNISRKNLPHQSFGGGAHMCIGAPLARLEAQVTVSALIHRFANLRLAQPFQTPVWRKAPFFHGIERLEVMV